jgi:hypothetical protein
VTPKRKPRKVRTSSERMCACGRQKVYEYDDVIARCHRPACDDAPVAADPYEQAARELGIEFPLNCRLVSEHELIAALRRAAEEERADCALYVAQQAAKITGHHPFDVEARQLLIATGDALRAGHRSKGKGEQR